MLRDKFVLPHLTGNLETQCRLEASPWFEGRHLYHHLCQLSMPLVGLLHWADQQSHSLALVGLPRSLCQVKSFWNPPKPTTTNRVPQKISISISIINPHPHIPNTFREFKLGPGVTASAITTSSSWFAQSTSKFDWSYTPRISMKFSSLKVNSSRPRAVICLQWGWIRLKSIFFFAGAIHDHCRVLCKIFNSEPDYFVI